MLKRRTPLLAVFLVALLPLLVPPAGADTTTYVIDPQSHNSCCSDLSQLLEIPVGSGPHTLCLTSEPAGSCTGGQGGANLFVFPGGIEGTCTDYT